MMDFTNPHFAEPGWLWLAVLAPLTLIALHRYAAAARRKQLALIAAPEFVRELTRSHSPFRRGIKETLLVLAAAGVGFALARPQWGEQESAGHVLGEDVVFVLDCSRSMLAADVAPDRLRRSRLAMLDFVRRHGRGRVGLVAFAGQAFLQCPLTLDYDAFEDALHAVDETTIPVPGTDIGRALDEAFRAMERTGRKKRIVLISDGEDLVGEGVATAETLAARGIVVYTLGVGTSLGADIKITNAQGQPELLRDRAGKIVRSRLEEGTLRAIARVTGGRYFALGPLGEGLARVRIAFETDDRIVESSSGRKLGVDRFHFPIAAVLAMLVAESLMGTRRRLQRAVRARMDESGTPGGRPGTRMES